MHEAGLFDVVMEMVGYLPEDGHSVDQHIESWQAGASAAWPGKG